MNKKRKFQTNEFVVSDNESDYGEKESEDECSESNETNEDAVKSEKKKKNKEKTKEDSVLKNEENDSYFIIGPKKRLTIRKWKSAVLIDIREFWTDKDGKDKPGKKGISLSQQQWEEIKANMDKIDREIEKLKNLDDYSKSVSLILYLLQDIRDDPLKNLENENVSIECEDLPSSLKRVNSYTQRVASNAQKITLTKKKELQLNKALELLQETQKLVLESKILVNKIAKELDHHNVKMSREIIRGNLLVESHHRQKGINVHDYLQCSKDLAYYISPDKWNEQDNLGYFRPPAVQEQIMRSGFLFKMTTANAALKEEKKDGSITILTGPYHGKMSDHEVDEEDVDLDLNLLTSEEE